MGILVDRYKFKANDHNWYFKTRYHLKGLRYTLTINGQTIHDEKRVMTAEDMLVPQTIEISYAGEVYKIVTAPVSAFTYGLHLHHKDAIIYKHKNREFHELKTLDGFIQKSKDMGIYDERPFWKGLTEALIIGALIGTSSAWLENALQDAGVIPQSADYLWVAIGLSVFTILFLPKKLRIIR